MPLAFTAEPKSSDFPAVHLAQANWTKLAPEPLFIGYRTKTSATPDSLVRGGEKRTV